MKQLFVIGFLFSASLGAWSQGWFHPAICKSDQMLGFKKCLMASDVIKTFSSLEECQSAVEILELEKSVCKRH